MTTTTPIDLDLVELRCKLRGWPVVYRYPASGPTTCIVVSPPGGRRVWVRPEGALLRNGDRVTTPELSAPRLTLADIIADPGEGWTVETNRTCYCLAHFNWHAAANRPRAAHVWLMPDGKVADSVSESVQGAERITAHRAVTDLLIRLAEVSDV